VAGSGPYTRGVANVLTTLAVSLLLLAATPASAGPTDQLREYTDQVVKVLDDPSMARQDRRAAVRKIAHEAFDISETAQRVLARHWQARTPAEREEFTQLFADLQSAKKNLLTYGLFLTTAVARPQGDGLFATVVRLNPVSPLMDAAREGAAGVAVSQPVALAVVLAAGALATAGGLLLVRAVAPIVVERMLLGGR